MEETIKFIVDEKRQKKIKDLLAQGFVSRCMGCGQFFKKVRREFYEDGHSGRFINMCSCGSDLFQKLKEVPCLNVKVEPGGVLIFKEHHAKYCRCEYGQLWTGDAETECFSDFELLDEEDDQKLFQCSKSGLKIIIWKSTREELENPDELGSTFLRIHG